MDFEAPCIGNGDASEYFEHGGLAGAIFADNPHTLPAFYSKTYVIESMKLSMVGPAQYQFLNAVHGTLVQSEDFADITCDDHAVAFKTPNDFEGKLSLCQ